MKKARKSPSKQVETFNQFLSYVRSPTETYIVGLFSNKDDNLFELYDAFASKYPEDFGLFHTFNTEDFIKNMRRTLKVSLPSILVYHHDLAVTKKEANAKPFDKVLFLFIRKIKIVIFFEILY
jgi:hypothetical protein